MNELKCSLEEKKLLYIVESVPIGFRALTAVM